MNYIINESTLFLEKNDNLDQVFICEENRKLYYPKRLLLIITNSCLNNGSSYKGRVDYTKKILNISTKIPIIISEKPLIIFFPINKDSSINNMWINFNKIDSYKQVNNMIEIVFINNIHRVIDSSFSKFNNQYLKCCNLYAIYTIKKCNYSFK